MTAARDLPAAVRRVRCDHARGLGSSATARTCRCPTWPSWSTAGREAGAAPRSSPDRAAEIRSAGARRLRRVLRGRAAPAARGTARRSRAVRLQPGLRDPAPNSRNAGCSAAGRGAASPEAQIHLRHRFTSGSSIHLRHRFTEAQIHLRHNSPAAQTEERPPTRKGGRSPTGRRPPSQHSAINSQRSTANLSRYTHRSRTPPAEPPGQSRCRSCTTSSRRRSPRACTSGPSPPRSARP